VQRGSSGRSAPGAAELSLGESVCLALIADESQHGWALVQTLGRDGDVGRVWSLSRPLTYRAIDGLLERGLVMHKGVAKGEGPQRRLLAATAAGRRHARGWLSEPVEHLREVRTVLLVKLVLTHRFGGDPLPLLRSQRRVFKPAFAALKSAGTVRNADVVDRWRYESSLAVQRFLDAAIRRG
jgi:DNA-binding PadR family transcriptional regulator